MLSEMKRFKNNLANRIMRQKI